MDINASVPESKRRDNLPASLSTFIGRQRELIALDKLLREKRLLTLTGPGGCGKTRLAVRTAGNAAGQYESGVWMVELAALAEPDLIPHAVTAVLGVQEEPGRALLDTLLTFLQERHVLLLLDNCEHLITACAKLAAAALQSCPNVTILATSREPLGVPGEHVWSVPSLTLPELQPWRSPAAEQEALRAVGEAEAIQLFLERARAAAPEFALEARNARAVADICRRLDGMPLAIELAAARVRMLSTQQIAERLDDRLRLLTNPARTVPDRQKTLEAALDWSYQLLSAAEQALLMRLSVFSGGWTLEAAEAVAAGAGIEPADVLDLLTGLVDKSLVTAERVPESGRRYSFLETVRQYSQARLITLGETEALRGRHFTFFVDWAAHAAPLFQDTDLVTKLAAFSTEYDNIRAALDWGLLAGNEAAPVLSLAVSCSDFWYTQGRLSEGRAYLARVLALPAAQADTRERARALLASNSLAWGQSDFLAARDYGEEALAVSARLGKQAEDLLAAAYCDLGDLYQELGEPGRAVEYLEHALVLFRDLEDFGQVAYVLTLLGWSFMRQGDLERAKECFDGCLTLARGLDAVNLLGLVLAALGELSVRQRQFTEAQAYLSESLNLRETIGYPWGIASTVGTLGWLALEERDYVRMRDLLRRSITIRLEIGEMAGVAWCLEKLAEAAVLQGHLLPALLRGEQYKRAAQILGAASAVRDRVSSAVDGADLQQYHQLSGELRTALGDEACDALGAKGAALGVEEVVALALEPPDTKRLSKERATKQQYGGLTAREREAAVLLARGLSNREMAETMTVGPRTIETYVTRILNKLNLSSRLQIAVWARKSGLLQDADSNT
ncbi:MAG: LuxR C-terminal-related transcriptional regulator [Candidatus Promineifilaceae bacterium]